MQVNGLGCALHAVQQLQAGRSAGSYGHMSIHAENGQLAQFVGLPTNDRQPQLCTRAWDRAGACRWRLTSLTCPRMVGRSFSTYLRTQSALVCGVGVEIDAGGRGMVSVHATAWDACRGGTG